jgi:predicted metalloendopeptidase
MSNKIRGLLGSAALALVATQVLAEDTRLKPLGPDQLTFSVANMDPSMDPGVDFYRYASGRWLDQVVRPSHLPSIGVFEYMGEHLKAQMVGVIQEAAAKAPKAAKGSPVQQVGAFYSAYMDLATIDALGVKPLEPEFARIDTLGSLNDLAEYLGRYTLVSGDLLLAGILPAPDRADATQTVFYAIAGALILRQGDIYNDPDTSPRIAAYKALVHDVLVVAGYDSARATRVADLSLSIERELHAAQVTPVEAVDPRNTYQPMTMADLQAQIPELDLRLIVKGLGAEAPDKIILTEPRYFSALAKMLKDRPLDDIKDYAKVKLLMKFLPYLTTRFDEPVRNFTQVMTGAGVTPPREEQALELLKSQMGQPVSRLYVDAYFAEETRQKATAMILAIKATFRERMEKATWLTPETKAAALEKLGKLDFKVGYPDQWIDYSGVDIGPDLVANVMNLIAFGNTRDLARVGKPVTRDAFNNSQATLPIIINAAYDTSTNGFEVPAAILQPAAFEPDRDAPVYFCRMGAVLGHEMTHGFDSGGRLFDAGGNLRDWWTAADTAAFEAEAQKLIDQANAFEVLPGLNANGPLNVKENMADVGGINFAYQALMDYLKAHPEEDHPIDGLTPSQRCFISWAQMWTMKATDQYLTNTVNGDNHPPNFYRATAALQHVDAFYEAFDIREGDPMWLAPEKRVHAW